MNRERAKGHWKQIKGKARQIWGDIRGDELDVVAGKRQELAGRLQVKYARARHRCRAIVKNVLKRGV